MEHILIASDLSDRSRLALRRALSLAHQFEADLSVLYVAEEGRPEDLLEEEFYRAEETLGELILELADNTMHLPQWINAKVGKPHVVIAEEAAAVGAELIVLGSHSKQLLGDVFTGTTVERVIREASLPVLMVNKEGDASYESVMAAVDLSEASANALRSASILGLMDADSTAVVHGFLTGGEGLMAYAGIEKEQIDEHVTVNAIQARHALEGFLEDTGFSKMANKMLIENGTPMEAIESGVRTFNPDLLIIGTRGQTGVQRVLLGSVAEQVLRRLECDVLAVPPST